MKKRRKGIRRTDNVSSFSDYFGYHLPCNWREENFRYGEICNWNLLNSGTLKHTGLELRLELTQFSIQSHCKSH